MLDFEGDDKAHIPNREHGVRSEPDTTAPGGQPAFAQVPVSESAPTLPNAFGSQKAMNFSGVLRIRTPMNPAIIPS